MEKFAARYYKLLSGNGNDDSAALSGEYMTQEGVAQDLSIPVEYLEDSYMVAEHRKAHRRMQIDWAEVGAIDGLASAGEVLFSSDRYNLERSERWGEGLVLMYDRVGLQPKNFDDSLLAVSRSDAPASIGCSGQIGPHADPEQTFGKAIRNGMHCYTLQEATRATIRYAKSQAPELASIAVGAALQAASRMEMMAQTPGSKVNEDGTAEMSEFSVEELSAALSEEDAVKDRHMAACEDASRVFPPRLLRKGERVEETEKLTSEVLGKILKLYSELPWGLKMCGTYPLYKTVGAEIRAAHADNTAEFLMQTGLMCSVDADMSTAEILRRTAHCCAYAETHKLASRKALNGLVEQLVKVS